MKFSQFIFLLSLGTTHQSLSANRDFKCALPLDISEISEKVDLETVKKTVSIADDYLVSIASVTTFEISEPAAGIQSLELIGKNIEIDRAIRSEAYRIASGLYGRISDKRRDQEGGVCGGISIRYLKRSLELNSNNYSSIIGFSKAMEGICLATAKYPKFFIEFGMKIKIASEAKSSLAYLRTLPKTPEQLAILGNFEELEEILSKCASGKSLAAQQNEN